MKPENLNRLKNGIDYKRISSEFGNRYGVQNRQMAFGEIKKKRGRKR